MSNGLLGVINNFICRSMLILVKENVACSSRHGIGIDVNNFSHIVRGRT